MVWLVGSEEAVTQHLLAHEVAHLVMAGQFGDSMPIWANEAVASHYDNQRRHELREQKLRGFVELDSWPRLERLFAEPVRQQWQYAAAVSVADYLIDRGGREKFMQFVAEAAYDADSALQTHYDIASVAELQQRWQAAVRENLGGASAQLASATSRARFVR